MTQVGTVLRLLELLTEDEMIQVVKQVEASINRRVRFDIECQTRQMKINKQSLDTEMQRINEFLADATHPSKRRQIEQQLRIVEDMREQAIKSINTIERNHSNRLVSFFHMGMPQG